MHRCAPGVSSNEQRWEDQAPKKEQGRERHGTRCVADDKRTDREQGKRAA